MPYATPEQAIRARLAATSGVNTPTGGRINPQTNTQEPTYPFVTFARLGGAPGSTLSGPSSLGRYTFQLDVYAETEAGAAPIAAAIDAAIGGWQDRTNGVHGAFPDDTAAEITDDPYRVWSRVFGIWFQPTS